MKRRVRGEEGWRAAWAVVFSGEHVAGFDSIPAGERREGRGREGIGLRQLTL
ncbi:hypothetical protein HAX54_039551, partial [Datura stramonium]|nr:hypothetical protein [Datura stramonium]